MKRNLRTLVSVAAAGLLAAALVACVVNLAFDMPQDLALDATGTTVNMVQAYDLSSVQVVQDHKNEVQSLSLDSLDVTVTDLKGATGTANQATTLSGSVALRPGSKSDTDNSADIQVGSVSNLQITNGATFHLKGNSNIDNFVLTTFKGSGQFKLVLNGSTQGEAHLKLHAVLHANLGYGSGL